MLWIGGIKLPQELDAIHELGNTGSNMVITIETDGTVCDGFGSLTVRSRYDKSIGPKPFLELGEEPRGRGKTPDKPNGFDHPSREDNLIPDGVDRSFYGGLKQLGDFITMNIG